MRRAVRGGEDEAVGVDADVDACCPAESLVVAPQAFSISLLASLAFEVRSDRSSFGSMRAE